MCWMMTLTLVFIKPKRQVSNQHPKKASTSQITLICCHLESIFHKSPLVSGFLEHQYTDVFFLKLSENFSCGVRLQNPFWTFTFKRATVLLFTPEQENDLRAFASQTSPSVWESMTRGTALSFLSFHRWMTESEIHVAIPLVHADRNPFALYFSSLAIIWSGNRSGLHQTQ